MPSHRRRYSKRELPGSLHVDYVMSVSDLGLIPGTNRWEVLRAFLHRGEGHAERLVEARDGFLILQSIPGRPNTGAIYIYREQLGAFFWLRFGERQDDLSGEDFQNALRIHRLMRFVADRPRRRHRRRPQGDAARLASRGSINHSNHSAKWPRNVESSHSTCAYCSVVATALGGRLGIDFRNLLHSLCFA